MGSKPDPLSAKEGQEEKVNRKQSQLLTCVSQKGPIKIRQLLINPGGQEMDL